VFVCFFLLDRRREHTSTRHETQIFVVSSENSFQRLFLVSAKLFSPQIIFFKKIHETSSSKIMWFGNEYLYHVRASLRVPHISFFIYVFLEKREKLIFWSILYSFPIYWQLANRTASCVKIRAAFVARIALPHAVF
jgi:hypothetical protein